MTQQRDDPGRFGRRDFLPNPSGQWTADRRAIIANAASVYATMAVTSGAGFVYWWMAARYFPPHAVGQASATISAMTLLGTLGMLGLGTTLMGTLAGTGATRAAPHVAAALAVAGGVSAFLGLAGAGLASVTHGELSAALAGSVGRVALFGVGVSLTATSLVLDQALIGLSRGGLQLWRNAVFAAAKLVALLPVSLWLSRDTGPWILATWVLGNALSLVAVLGPRARQWPRRSIGASQWSTLKALGRPAFGHHLLNLVLLAPGLGLPLITTMMISAEATAYLYVAWMIAGAVWVIPVALTTVLYPAGAANLSRLPQKTRFTLGLALVLGIGAVAVIWVAADRLLALFGSSYATQAGMPLRILALAALPLTANEHFVAICRARARIGWVTRLMIGAAIAKLAAAAIGIRLGGLIGLSIAVVAVESMTATCTLPAVFRVIARGGGDDEPRDRGASGRFAADKTRPR